MQKTIKLTLWLLFILAIFLLSLLDLESMTGRDMSNGFAIRHILTFSVFVLLTKITWPRWHVLQIVLAALGLGIAIEIAQELFTGGVRHFHWHDLMNDCIGVIVGLIVIFLYQVVRQKVE
ncbi:MAG: VanZ family protein [Bacteroidota bacterium]|nr:VanZ family protein [Bacteroidota bacterium]